MLELIERVMTGVVLVLMVILAPFALFKHIVQKAKRLGEYFSNHKVIFKNEKKNCKKTN